MKKIIVLVAFLIFINNQTKAQFSIGFNINTDIGNFYLGNDGFWYSSFYPAVQNGWYYNQNNGGYYIIPDGCYCPNPWSTPRLIPQGCRRQGYYNIIRLNDGYNNDCNNGWGGNNSGWNYPPPRHHYGHGNRYGNGYGRRHHNHYYGGR